MAALLEGNTSSKAREEQGPEEEIHHTAGNKTGCCSSSNKGQVVGLEPLDSTNNDGDDDGLGAPQAHPAQPQQVMMSPTDAMVSPCSKQLLQQRRKPHGLRMWGSHQLPVRE